MLGPPALKRGRGPQKAPTKILTTVRLDADVLAFFKAQGRGYLTRINNELRKVAARALPARAHLETAHLTKSRANARRLRGAHAEIEAEIARRKRQAA